MNITLDRAQAIAELLRAVQGKRVVHYLEHGKNPATELKTGVAKAFVDKAGKTPHKDTDLFDLQVKFAWNGAPTNGNHPMEGFETILELVIAIECGRFYIDGDLSHSS